MRRGAQSTWARPGRRGYGKLGLPAPPDAFWRIGWFFGTWRDLPGDYSRAAILRRLGQPRLAVLTHVERSTAWHAYIWANRPEGGTS